TPTPPPTPLPTPTPAPLPAGAIGLKVLNTSVPAGGIFQWQLSNTEPKPIGHGSTRPQVPPGPVRGVAVNDPSGKAAGIALVPPGGSNTNISIQLSSPDALLGTDISYPVVTMSMPLSASLTAGQTFTIGMDTASALFADATKNYTTLEFAPGTLTIAAVGSPYVTNVIPGGGLLADRSAIRILGAGFTANTRIAIEGTTIVPADSTFVNSGEIDVKICNGTVADGATACPNNGTSFQLDGERVRVKDQSTNFTLDYYTYLRAEDDPAFPASGNTLVTEVHPMFSRQTYLAATIPLVQSATQFTGLALQNTSGTDDGIKVELLDANNASLANTSFILHAGKKIERDVIQDLFNGTVPNGAAKVRMTVTSGNALQALGMLGDTSAGTVAPVIPQ
ncbi:MAG TPA: hypothetical protein VKL99_12245, partial [Candidatus Angelobacter sp.]|nr:hypothetical protein [Candidatus Angelobacter sp.]